LDNVFVNEKTIELLQCLSAEGELKLSNAACCLNLSIADTCFIADVLTRKNILQYANQRIVFKRHMNFFLNEFGSLNRIKNRIPKGFNLDTLNFIAKIVKELSNEWIGTAQEIADLAGVSKSTARRYLEYFVEHQTLYRGNYYQKVGRPIARYGKSGYLIGAENTPRQLNDERALMVQ